MKVTAYKAKDGSLHEQQVDQLQRDLDLTNESFTQHVTGIATVCSQRTANRSMAAISSTEDFREMLSYLFLHHRDMVDQILRETDQAGKLRERIRQMKLEDADDEE